MPRRVRRPADKESLFKELTDGDDAIFETYKDLMVCAACIGFSHGSRKPFDRSLEPIAWNIFNGQTDAAIVNAIALAEEKELDVLLETEDAFDRKLTIFEEYANAGLEMIKQRVLDLPGSALENMLDLVFEFSPDRVEVPDLDLLSKLAKQVRG